MYHNVIMTLANVIWYDKGISLLNIIGCQVHVTVGALVCFQLMLVNVKYTANVTEYNITDDKNVAIVALSVNENRLNVWK